MDMGKALTLAKQLRNHFRIFEELEQFMREAVALQNVTKEYEARKTRLVTDINALGLDKAKLLDSTVELKKKKQGEFEKALVEMGEQLTASRAKITAEIKSSESERNAVESCLKEATKLHDQEMERMRLETEQAKAILKTVQGKIQAIKAKLE